MFEYVNNSEIIKYQDVVNLYSEIEIFKIVFDSVELNKNYKSPFRTDNNADCKFEYYNDTLYFVDWGDHKINRNCVGAVMDFYNIPYINAIYNIHKHFNNLILTNVIPLRINKHEEIRYKFPIEYETKSFTQVDSDYWKQFEIEKKHLEEDGVKSLKWYKFFSKKRNKFYYVPVNDRGYIYTDFDDKKVKIYRPYNQHNKWITSCNKNDIGSLKFINKRVAHLIITKSYKDCRVLRNLGYNSVWFQSETQFPDKNLIQSLTQSYKRIYILFDNDVAGINASKKLYDIIKVFNPNVNNLYLFGLQKDVSEFIEHNKKENLIEFLQNTVKNS